MATTMLHYQICQAYNTRIHDYQETLLLSLNPELYRRLGLRVAPLARHLTARQKVQGGRGNAVIPDSGMTLSIGRDRHIIELSETAVTQGFRSINPNSPSEGVIDKVGN